jgi:hypothetical protein
MYSRRASRIKEERFTRARLAAPFAASSNSESNTIWMVSILWKILHSMINSQPTRARVPQRLVAKQKLRTKYRACLRNC